MWSVMCTLAGIPTIYHFATSSAFSLIGSNSEATSVADQPSGEPQVPPPPQPATQAPVTTATTARFVDIMVAELGLQPYSSIVQIQKVMCFQCLK